MHKIIQKIAGKVLPAMFLVLAAGSANKAVAQCTPSGNQTSFGDNEWIGYVYTDVDLSGAEGPSNAFTGTYAGYITPGQTFDVHLLQTEPLTGPQLCGAFLDGYSVRFKMHLDLEPNYYTFTVGGDDGYRLSLDGGDTFPAGLQAWYDHGNIQSIQTYYIDGPVDLVMEYYEDAIDAVFTFNYQLADCSATVPTSVLNTEMAACAANTTVTAVGGIAGTAFYQWGSGSTVGSNVTGGNASTLTVYAPGTYWVRRGTYSPCRQNPNEPDYTDGYVFEVTQQSVGDQTTYGNGEWIVYGYQGNNATMTANAYRGYYTDSSLSFNSESKFAQAGANPSNADTWVGCTWEGDNDFWFEARRSGFECGEYMLYAQKWDDEIWVYVDVDGPGAGTETLAFHFNGWSGPVLVNDFIGAYYLNADSRVRIVLREAGGDASARVRFDKLSTAPAGITGDASLCSGNTITLTANGGNVGTSGTYQWGSGTVSDENVIAGESGATISVTPETTTTYWVRIAFPGACSTDVTENTSHEVTVSNTVPGTLATTHAAICKNTGIKPIVLSGHNGNVLRWESADDAGFTENVVTYDVTVAVLTAADTGDLAGSKYFRAVVQDGSCAELATPALLITVTPAVIYTTENGWSGAYDATTAVEFRDDYTITEHMGVCSCLVTDNAEVTVAEEIDFTVHDRVTVHTGASLTFENKASLLQTEDVANIGSINVMRASSKIMRLDYTIWSSPVMGQQLKEFSSQTLDNRFYNYNTFTDLYNHQDPLQDFETAKGYLIRSPNNHSDTVPLAWTGTFSGQPHNGNVTRALVYYGENEVPESENEEGEEPQLRTASYNAVGNPYASPIDVNDFFDANENLIAEQLWFWRKTNNSEESSYCTLTRFAFNANSAPGGSNDFAIDPDGVINTGQGFFVNALAPGNLVFTNSMRRGTSSNQFFRSAQNSDASRMWINVANDSGAFSQTVIGYTADATLGFDNGIDGKILGSGAIKLYSSIDGYSLAIQGRPAFDPSDVVPLGYKAAQAGQYEFTLDHADGIFAEGQDMYLLDALTGTTHNLRESGYSFTTEAGTFGDRFSVVYAETLGNGGVDGLAQGIIVYNKDKQVNITAPKAIASVAIYDMRGRMLYQIETVNSETFATPTLAFAEGIVIVKVKLADNALYSKKIIFE